MPGHKCQPKTTFTVMAGVVSQCECGIVHRVQHKTVLESPCKPNLDPQLTFDEYIEQQVLNALQDEEADHWAAENEDHGSEF